MEEFKYPAHVRSSFYLKRKADQEPASTLNPLFYGAPRNSSPPQMSPLSIGPPLVNIKSAFVFPPFNDKQSPAFSPPYSEDKYLGRQSPVNPLVPPVRSCGICRNNVNENQQPILCAGCNFWFHRICTGLEETAFYFLTMEKNAKWVCDSCFSSQKQSEISNETLIGEMEELLSQIQ